ncbi:MAG: hypothetical protein KDB26_11760, partial [Microthrixaceae bacterium]|nr:hypothetical protein [Microthrixaceae bacterium]
ERRHARRFKTPIMHLEMEELASMSTASEPNRADTSSYQFLVSTDPGDKRGLARVTRPSRKAVTVSFDDRDPASSQSMHRDVVCVADPYGLFNATVRALGVASLPDVATITDLVSSLGWSETVGIRATLPDLSDPNHDRNPDKGIQAAWLDRDSELDALAAQFDGDGDDSTVQRRALLRPSRARTDGRYERDVSPYAIKRQSVGLLLDLWTALQEGVKHVVLLSEDPDLIFALEHLPAAGISRFSRTVRVGLHARLYSQNQGLGEAPTTPLPFVVLTERQAAALCRCSGRSHGTQLRHAIAGFIQSTDAEWKFERIDPESQSIVMSVRSKDPTAPNQALELDGRQSESSNTMEGVEVNVFGLTDLFNESPEAIEDAVRALPLTALTFDPERPCAHPIIDAGPTSRTKLTSGTVVSHQGTNIKVDFDGDRKPDAQLTVGHTLQRFPSGTLVDVGLREGKASLLDPGKVDDEVHAAEVVELIGWRQLRGHDEVYPEVRSVLDGVHGFALPPPGVRTLTGDIGSRFFAARRNNGAGQVSWVALSSPLEHLL